MMIEETELRDAARRLLDAESAADANALWSAVCEAGWTAITSPEEAGGLEQPPVTAGWLHEELGRALCGAPLMTSLMAVDTLSACPPSAERDAWLERITGGEAIAASLLTPGANSVSASPSRNLSGSLKAVLGADIAGHVLVAVKAPATVAIVPINGAGLSVHPQKYWDETRQLADVVFDSASMDSGAILATGSAAENALCALDSHLHYAVAADSLGGAEAMLEATIEFMGARHQFDRPLAMFQALKHRCADMRSWISAAKALLTERLTAAPTLEAPSPASAMATKALASSVFRDVAEDCMQLHGGVSMTVEYECHRYLKRALLNEHLASGNDACDRAAGDAVFAAA